MIYTLYLRLKKYMSDRKNIPSRFDYPLKKEKIVETPKEVEIPVEGISDDGIIYEKEVRPYGNEPIYKEVRMDTTEELNEEKETETEENNPEDKKTAPTD